jgi:hypothetical protein
MVCDDDSDELLFEHLFVGTLSRGKPSVDSSSSFESLDEQLSQLVRGKYIFPFLIKS